MRHPDLNLLKMERTVKAGIKAGRHTAGRDFDCMTMVLPNEMRLPRDAQAANRALPGRPWRSRYVTMLENLR